MRTSLQPVSVRIVADDLTGACDAAVAFACAGMTAEVEPNWNVRESSNAQVIAYNTESRDIPPEASMARMAEVGTLLMGDGADHLFKKIDSVFRGNTFTEIASYLSSVPHALAILAPAFPELGRTLKDGHLICSDLTGSSTLEVEHQLRRTGVILWTVAAGASLTTRMKDACEAGAKVLLCDSQTQQDLLEIVRTTLAMNVPGQILWIGSGGLAHALAANLGDASAPRCPVTQGKRVLFLVGSDHPVTLKQVAHLKLVQKDCIVLPIGRAISVAALRQTVEPCLSEGISCVFATGGDTALAFCRAMQITRLQLQCEFDRGLPQSRIVGGSLDGATLILKSGGFGEESVLARIAQAFTYRDGTRPMTKPRIPTIAITLGDPAGIGVEVTLKALGRVEVRSAANWIIFGDEAAIAAGEKTTGVRFSSLGVTLRDARLLDPAEPIQFGALRADYGAAAARYVHDATLMCLDGGADAMVTAPLNKGAVTMSGLKFSGHTEYIAELCGATDSRMLLAGVKLSVVHVSTHTSLRNACNLETARIIRTIQLGDEAMKLLGHARPRIAVCGLNPHAGEHGLFGSEDEEFIRPAIETCRAMGIDCEGPEAPDTIFYRAARGSHDLIVAMYHDQGHIPMKLLEFEATVNTSLGIPIIRTSVDHGTAFDIAGKNIAGEGNMVAAMKMAVTMATNRIVKSQIAERSS
jgi:4-phospho-D-threonate 3-dehydrogenase / 4-phospho-D-erythronate 3-dehydrogenase